MRATELLPRSAPALGALVFFALTSCTAPARESRAAWRHRAPWIAHTIDGNGRGADGVRAADFDRDGRPDLVVPWEEAGEVRLYRNPGPELAAAPWPAVVVGSVPSVEDALPFDIDGDGDLDIASATEGESRTIFAHLRSPDGDPWSSGRWTTAPFPESIGQGSWLVLTPGDFGGGGGADLAAGGRNGGPLALLIAPEMRGDLASWKMVRAGDARWAMSIEALDRDGDGRAELLVSDRERASNGLNWLERSGAGPAWRERSLAVTDSTPFFLDVRGFDDSRRGEIAVAQREGSILLISVDGGRVVSTETVRLPEGIGRPKAARFADLDDDGAIDVAVSCEDAYRPLSGVVWLRRQDRDWTVDEVSGPIGTKFDRIEPLDLDADGDLDLVTTEEMRLGVVWYENPQGAAVRPSPPSARP